MTYFKRLQKELRILLTVPRMAYYTEIMYPKNKPYVKLYVTEKDGHKTLINPITKDRPYIHFPKAPNPKQSSNNKKGIKLLIVNIGKGVFAKYEGYDQLIPIKGSRKKKRIQHYVETNRRQSA